MAIIAKIIQANIFLFIVLITFQLIRSHKNQDIISDMTKKYL